MLFLSSAVSNLRNLRNLRIVLSRSDPMSIPDRVWRVVKGYWSLAEDRVTEAQAQADAYDELAEALRRSDVQPVPREAAGVLPQRPAVVTGPGQDPLSACYELLQV